MNDPLPKMRVALLIAMTTLSGCDTLPTGGPQLPTQPVSTDPQVILPHFMVVANPSVAAVASAGRDFGGLGSFASRGGAADIRLGVGDVVSVTIFEAAAGGLFIPGEAGSRAGNFVTIPDQQVDRRGTISVPYAGQIPVTGRRPPEVQAEIESRLRNRAIEPQVVVALRDQKATQVSVLGEVNQPARLAVNPAGERILDVIARAGGPKGQGYESFVTLQRGPQKRSVYFNRIVNDPTNNIFVNPGDTVYVYRENRSYVILGASGFNGKYNFESEQMTAAEGVGKAGGLLDERANPSAVYIYRTEPRAVAQRLGLDLTGWPAGDVPIIYNFNLRSQDGMFTLQQFQLRDKDVIFIGNAQAVELAKALNIIRIGVATVNEGNSVRYLNR
ncbi:sugar ABC transporter substrate-binding protein [Alsobacter metallidurans]|uniref:Sugar ABC transporter substrate-binding protein n=1 Tax=Alsobacter metallidurans TaxID=340221 RepID=A0A917I714_9HYPH|nr:polysaccharide biosynthesis/export family protein [Alsobacter metallidurans]GGH17272.1 sugar ABC transporter substrate-binding protein [Alsobacter metallidurans]